MNRCGIWNNCAKICGTANSNKRISSSSKRSYATRVTRKGAASLSCLGQTEWCVDLPKNAGICSRSNTGKATSAMRLYMRVVVL